MDIWGVVHCPECGLIGNARKSPGRVDVFLDVHTCYHPKETWDVIVQEDLMPKHRPTVPARVRNHDALLAGEIKVVNEELMMVSCPTCATKTPPSGTFFMANVGSTGGDPFTCPACGYIGHVVDGAWRKL
jgi:hypothetical protein